MRRMIQSSLPAVALIALTADPTLAAEYKSMKNLKVEEGSEMLSPRPPCVDDLSYKSKAGLLCAQHASLDCRGFGHLGFDVAEVDELLRKCPVSCQVEPCVSNDNEDDVTDKDDEPISPNLSQSKDKESNPSLTQYIRRRTNQEACIEGWDLSCQDNSLYVSPIQSDCSIALSVFGQNCAQAITIGFTISEVNELIRNCPCSCEIECATLQPVISGDSEDGGAIHSSVVAEGTEIEEEGMVEEGGGFSFQTMMEEYGIFIYAGVGAVVLFIGVVYVVRSYQQRNVEAQRRRDRAYSFDDYDDYGSRTEVSGQSRSRVSFWGYN